MKKLPKKFSSAIDSLDRALINNAQAQNGKYVLLTYKDFCELWHFVQYLLLLKSASMGDIDDNLKIIRRKFFKLSGCILNLLPREIAKFFFLDKNFKNENH